MRRVLVALVLGVALAATSGPEEPGSGVAPSVRAPSFPAPTSTPLELFPLPRARHPDPTPAPTPRPTARPTLPPAIGPAFSGSATYYCDPPRSPCAAGFPPGLFAAAGPALRAALGPGWRGRIVRVRYGSKHVDVRLIDSCGDGCLSIVDLYAVAFRRLVPLGVGRIDVVVSLVR